MADASARRHQTAIALRTYQSARDTERAHRANLHQVQSAARGDPALDEPLRIARAHHNAAARAVDIAEATALAISPPEFIERMQTEFDLERSERRAINAE